MTDRSLRSGPSANPRGVRLRAGQRRRVASAAPPSGAADVPAERRAAAALGRRARGRRRSSLGATVAVAAPAHRRHVAGHRAPLRPGGHRSSTASFGWTCRATSAQAAGEFLSKFPGFADQAALDTKLDEALDQLIGDETDGKQTFTRGHQALVRRRVRLRGRRRCPTRASCPAPARRLRRRAGPDPAVGQGPGRRVGLVRLLIAIERRDVHDRDLRGRHVDRRRPTAGTSHGAPSRSSAATSPSPATSPRSRPPSTRRAPASLASTRTFKAAAGASKDDHFGFAYVDAQALMDSALDASGAHGSDVPTASGESLADLVPDWIAFDLRVEPDALVGDATTPHVDRPASAPTTNRVNQVVPTTFRPAPSR